MAKIPISYIDFRGGLNVDSAPDNLADNQLEVADNINLDLNGGINDRFGTEPFNSISFGAEVHRIEEWLRDDGSTMLMAIIGTTLAKVSDSGVKTDIFNLASINIGYFVYKNKWCFCDGTNFKYYDGTNLYDFQPPTPSSAPLLSAGGSGSGLSAGTYRYKITYLNSIGSESESSPSASVTVTAGQEVTLTLPVAPVGYDVTARRIYRTPVNKSADEDYRLVYEIEDNVTTTYIDRKADVDLGDLIPFDNNLAPIKKCNRFMWHPKSLRLFATGNPDDRIAIYYSESNSPWYFKEVSVLYPTTGDGPTDGLSLFGEGLVTHFRNSHWIWKGVDPSTDAEWYKLPVGFGTVAGETVALTPGSMTFLTTGSIMAISLGVLDYAIVMATSDDMAKDLTNNKTSKIVRSIVHPETCRGIFDYGRTKYFLAYGDDPNNTRNNKILVLDWNSMAFTRYTGIQANDFCLRSSRDLLIASKNYILKANDNLLKDWDVDNHCYKPVVYKAYSKQWDLGFPLHQKVIKQWFIMAKQNTDGKINVTLKSGNYQVSYTDVGLDISFVWGDPWGEYWGWDDYVMRELETEDLRGHRFQIRITKALMDSRATIYGTGFVFKRKKAKGVKLSG